MIRVHYNIRRESQGVARLSLLDEQVIRLRRPPFDAALARLACDNGEHADFENIVNVNVSPDESFGVEKVCCAPFEERIVKALAGACKKGRA